MDIHEFQKETFVPVQIGKHHSDPKPHWFLFSKFGFMDSSAWASEIAPTD